MNRVPDPATVLERNRKMRPPLFKTVRRVVTGLALLGVTTCRKDAEPLRPNIVIILADDMGFSDLGCYGGEIETPNLDRLARNGLRYTQFYNTSRCCPTRASLLTGLYSHQTGMGWMTAADLNRPGYTGQLNHQSVTIAEVLRQAGYATYMSGKWHLSLDKNLGPEGPTDSWPRQRGFDRYFGPLYGGGSYFTMRGWMYCGSPATADSNACLAPGSSLWASRI